jgi:hypothetical protein
LLQIPLFFTSNKSYQKPYFFFSYFTSKPKIESFIIFCRIRQKGHAILKMLSGKKKITNKTKNENEIKQGFSQK